MRFKTSVSSDTSRPSIFIRLRASCPAFIAAGAISGWALMNVSTTRGSYIVPRRSSRMSNASQSVTVVGKGDPM